MTTLIALLCVQARAKMALSPSETDLLIVADTNWDKAHLDGLLAGTPGGGREPLAVRQLTKLGYVAYEDGGVKFLFAPSIWQEDVLERARELHKRLANAVGSDGVLKGNTDPFTTDVARSILGGCGGQFSDQSAAAIEGGAQYSLSSGEKTVTLTGSIRYPKEVRNKLKAAPASYSSSPYRGPHSISDFTPIWPTEYKALGFGKYSSPRRRSQGLELAVAIVNKRFAKIELELAQMDNALAKSLTGVNPGQYQGKLVSDLPANVSSDIEGNLLAHYAENGFSSESEAEEFLKNATVSSMQFKAYLCAYLSTGSSGGYGVAVQLP